MKITVQVAGKRNGHTIAVAVSAVDGMVGLEVPTVARANACAFEVDASELAKALEFLQDSGAAAAVRSAPAKPATGREASA